MSEHPERLWCEQDFTELYEEEPIIATSPTYTTITVKLPDDSVNVKIPTGASSEAITFLLKKGIFFHLLDVKHCNPLYEVAIISHFEAENDPSEWYFLFFSHKKLDRKITLKPVYYMEGTVLNGKYMPLCVMESESPFTSKILMRSTQTSQYKTTYIHISSSSPSSPSSPLSSLEQIYRTLQHPFLVKLEEIFRDGEIVAFVFEHIPYTFSEVFSQKGQNLLKPQIKILISELILALLFLEQQQIVLGLIDMSLEMLGVGGDGHLVINEKIVENYATNKGGSGRCSVLEFVFEIFNLLVCTSLDVETNLNNPDEPCEELDFAQFLQKCMENAKGFKIKDLLSHPYIGASYQKVLTKSQPVFTKMDEVKPVCFQHSLNSTSTKESQKKKENQNSILQHLLQKEKFNKFSVQSFKITKKTVEETLIEKYEHLSEKEKKNKQKNYEVKGLGSNNYHNLVSIYNRSESRRLLKTNSTLSLKNKSLHSYSQSQRNSNASNISQGQIQGQANKQNSVHGTIQEQKSTKPRFTCDGGGLKEKSPYFTVLRKEGKRNKAVRV